MGLHTIELRANGMGGDQEVGASRVAGGRGFQRSAGEKPFDSEGGENTITTRSPLLTLGKTFGFSKPKTNTKNYERKRAWSQREGRAMCLGTRCVTQGGGRALEEEVRGGKELGRKRRTTLPAFQGVEYKRKDRTRGSGKS